MILSHRHQFIFFCNGKTGTTSIEAVLEPFQEGREFDFGIRGLFVPKHVPPALLRGCLPSITWNTYFKFVFVRNPWDWFVSNWKYNASRANFSRLRPTGHRTSANWNIARLFHRPREIEPVFDTDDVDTVFAYLRRFRGLPGTPGLYQSNYVFDVDGNRLVDYVGRFETLEEDFGRIRDRLSLDLRLPHLNRTERSDYRSYFTAGGRQRLAELWATDIENFGYEF